MPPKPVMCPEAFRKTWVKVANCTKEGGKKSLLMLIVWFEEDKPTGIVTTFSSFPESSSSFPLTNSNNA